MLRTIITLSVIALATGCTQDYKVQSIEEVANSGGDVTDFIDEMETHDESGDYNGEVEEDNEDDQTQDRPEGDNASCWFEHDQWYSNDTVWTRSLPVLELVTKPEQSIYQGNEVDVTVSLSALKGCGDIKINSLFFLVQDPSQGSYEWLKSLNDAALDSRLDTGDGNVYVNAAQNMYVTQTGDELFYPWSDEDGVAAGEAYSAWMETLTLTETPVEVTFTWTGSSYAPVGSTIEVMLILDWTDVENDQFIWDDYAYLDPSFTTVTITD